MDCERKTQSPEAVIVRGDSQPAELTPQHENASEPGKSTADVENENSADELVRFVRADEPDAADLATSMQSVIDARYYNCAIRRNHGVATVGCVESERRRLRKQYGDVKLQRAQLNNNPILVISITIPVES